MAFEGWNNWIPPREWERILAMDVGGSSPNALTWTAIDPTGFVVVYDEVYLTTTDMRAVADLALPKMKDLDGLDYKWKAKVGDYENRIALADMAKFGIRFDNAIKRDKLLSVHRLAGYLHPNPKRPFPIWHPKAGQLGAPLMFIMAQCKNVIREVPQQRWKEGQGESLKDEMDRSVSNHTVDCLLYTVRILPPPMEVKITPVATKEKQIDLRSALYWEDVRRRRDKTIDSVVRQAYRASHTR